MFKYVVKRIALMFVVLSVILTMCVILVKLLPVVDATQFGKDMNLILQRREALGYNKPLLVQLGIFFQKSVFGGDWGISEALYRGQDVWAVFVGKLPATMIVNLYSILLSIPFGIALVIFAALKKNTWIDHAI